MCLKIARTECASCLRVGAGPTVLFDNALKGHEPSIGFFSCAFLECPCEPFGTVPKKSSAFSCHIIVYHLTHDCQRSNNSAFMAFDARTVMRFPTLPKLTYNISTGTKIQVEVLAFICDPVQGSKTILRYGFSPSKSFSFF